MRDTKVHENGKVSRFTVNASTLIFSYTDTHTHNPTLSIYLCLSLSEHIHLIKRMRRKQNDISKFDLLSRLAHKLHIYKTDYRSYIDNNEPSENTLYDMRRYAYVP